MVDVGDDVRKDHIRGLERTGAASGLDVDRLVQLDPILPRILQHHQREVEALRRAITYLLNRSAVSPIWGGDKNNIVTVSFEDLATVEFEGVTYPRSIIFRHNATRPLTNMVTISRKSTHPAGWGGGVQPAFQYSGDLVMRRTQADAVVIQADTVFVENQLVFEVALYRRDRQLGEEFYESEGDLGVFLQSQEGLGTDEFDGTGPPLGGAEPSYVVMALTADLSNERRLQATTPITLTDAGPNADATLSVADGAIANAKLADMAADTVKLRNAGTTGVPGDVKVSGLTEESAPAAGDWLMGEEAGGGELRKFDLANLNHLDGVEVFVQDTKPGNPSTDSAIWLRTTDWMMFFWASDFSQWWSTSVFEVHKGGPNSIISDNQFSRTGPVTDSSNGKGYRWNDDDEAVLVRLVVTSNTALNVALQDQWAIRFMQGATEYYRLAWDTGSKTGFVTLGDTDGTATLPVDLNSSDSHYFRAIRTAVGTGVAAATRWYAHAWIRIRVDGD